MNQESPVFRHGECQISCIVYANSEQEAVAQFQGYDYVEATLIES